MKKLRRFIKRLTSWATTPRDEERLRAEIEEHLGFQIEDNLRAGLSPQEARRQAVLKFGAVEAVKEDYRDRRGMPLMESLVQDTRYSLRRLRKSPAFTVTVVLTLALGIGATTSIFTLVHAVLLKSLAVANPSELYRLGKQARCCYWPAYSQDKEFSIVSYDLYKQFRDNTPGFAELAAFQAGGALFGVRRTGARESAQSIPGEFVSGNYFNMFGVRAYAGRMLAPSDDRAGAPPVAVMSYRLWQQRYGSDPSVVGGVFNLDEKPVTVVGIAPPSFFGDQLRPVPPDFFLPLNAELAVEGVDDLNQAESWLDLIGRIRPGAKTASIEAEMRVELQQWLRSHWGDMDANDRARLPEQTLFLEPGGAGISNMRDQYEHWLQVLMMVSGFVLLIVCANVANLMLVRGMERRRQISLSMALGARAGRLVQQALTESVLLGIVGGAAGLAIAFAGTRLILDIVFPRIPGLGGVPISASPSTPVLVFTLAVSLLTGIAFGIAPAWVTARVDPIEALRGASRSTARAGSLPRKTLVVLQAALSLVLLTASGLLTAALGNLENQKFGFVQDGRMIVSIDARLAGYHGDQLAALYTRLQDSLSRVPGVSAVALCLLSPQGGNNWGGTVWADGHPPPGPRDDNFAFWDRVTPGFFDAVGNRILRGRAISEEDTADSQHVVVINEAFARKFFRNEDPIGKYFGRPGVSAGSSHQYEVVGVAQDARYLNFDFDKPISPFFFLPAAQYDIFKTGAMDPDPGSHFLHDIVVVTRTGANPSFAQLRQAIASVDPNLPVVSMQSLREQVAGQFGQQRLLAWLTSFFGALSLILASIGLYGITAYNAGRRTNEIGVRLALGATRAQAASLIIQGAFVLVAVGLVLGIPLALAAGRFLGSQLYGLNPYDPAVILVAAMTLGCSALAAAFAPALRASRISPSAALRTE
ncbi:MAG TPA: ABC transporter permease [Terriglobia bacterium]|jgi:predicted permease|nr:ABC transporter permease [Terriglobia bacterium]